MLSYIYRIEIFETVILRCSTDHQRYIRWVVFLSGLAHITLPNSTTEAWVEGGKNGVILALDTVDVSAFGHFTTYPSQERTTAVQIPLGEKGVPGHWVLHEGPCSGEEVLL